jgi:hypothetical protein
LQYADKPSHCHIDHRIVVEIQPANPRKRQEDEEDLQAESEEKLEGE